jgi:hypothetical protein
MKKIINAIYTGLIDWAEIIAEYRKSSASRHYF